MNGMSKDFYHTCPYRRLADPMLLFPAIGMLSLALAYGIGRWHRQHEAAQKPVVAVQQVPKQRQAGPEFPQWKKS